MFSNPIILTNSFSYYHMKRFLSLYNLDLSLHISWWKLPYKAVRFFFKILYSLVSFINLQPCISNMITNCSSFYKMREKDWTQISSPLWELKGNDLTSRLQYKFYKENLGVRNICCFCRGSEFRFQLPIIDQNLL